MSIQYPQHEFSSSIIKSISVIVSQDKIGIDIPCGMGITTYHLARKIKLKWTGVDLNPKLISIAKHKYSLLQLDFRVEDIYEFLNRINDISILCVINSVFLLPDQEYLFSRIHKSLSHQGQCFIIIPNIQGINYKNFIIDNPTTNSSEYTKEEFAKFLEAHHFRVDQIEEICYANLYGRKEIKYLSRLTPYYLIVLNWVMAFFKIGTPSYFLFKIARQ